MAIIGRRNGMGLIAGAALVLGSVAAAYGNKSAREFFDPVVSHHQFSMLVQELNLDHQQRMIADLVFSDYADGMADLIAEADKAADDVGRQHIIAAFSGRRLIDPDELRRLRLDVLEVYRGYWPQVDRYFDNLVSGVASLLVDDQRSGIEAGLRHMRRSLLLQPRRANEQSYEYAGDGVDMLLLIDRAKRENGELHGLSDDALSAIRSGYETQLDALLLETADAHRRARMDWRVARIRRDHDAIREAQRASLEIWRQLFELNQRTMRQVGEVAASRLGEDAKTAWQQRYDESCFPWLFTRSTPDRQYEWLRGQQLTAEQLATADQAMADFEARRRDLRSEAIRVMLMVRLEMQEIIYAMLDSSAIPSPIVDGLHKQLLRNTGDLASAEAAATAAFESLLNDSQRNAMRRATRR